MRCFKAFEVRSEVTGSQSAIGFIKHQDFTRMGVVALEFVCPIAQSCVSEVAVKWAIELTVDKAPSFRQAFAKRRCLMPADGLYE
jgi:putative SOS response-associated peptidase YedK